MVVYADWITQKDWVLRDQIGKGAFSIVYAAQSTHSQNQAAVKVLDKTLVANTEENIKSEAEILIHLSQALPGHQALPAYIGAYQDANNVYLVMELCTGPRLAEEMSYCHTYSESHAAWIIRQLALALNDLHKINVIHRDIKPENLMYSTNTPAADLKLIDFGFSTQAVGSQKQAETVGSYNYVAPEVLRFQEYAPSCDIWALGVIMYKLISGKVPFTNELQVKMAPLTFYEEVWKACSSECRDLVKKLLVKEGPRRPCAEVVLRHAWLSKAAAPSFNHLPPPLPSPAALPDAQPKLTSPRHASLMAAQSDQRRHREGENQSPNCPATRTASAPSNVFMRGHLHV